MKNRESERTLVTIANGEELVALITKNVVGEEVADMYDGAPLTLDAARRLALVKFQGCLSNHLGN
jgi:hypothetical protein